MTTFNSFFKALTGMDYPHQQFQSPIDRGELGLGMKLIDMDIPDNKNHYGNLYRNGIKLNDTIFRIGGLCSGFKNGSYCELIQYDNIKDFGTHCLIDANGDIVLKAPSMSVYPCYHKGVIASMDNIYYNLRTGKPIVKGNKYTESSNFLFVENCYTNEYKKGVYKIEYSTGNYEIFE